MPSPTSQLPTRRRFLQLAAAGAGMLLVSPRLVFARAATERRFVFVIQRGGADGPEAGPRRSAAACASALRERRAAPRDVVGGDGCARHGRNTAQAEPGGARPARSAFPVAEGRAAHRDARNRRLGYAQRADWAP